MIDIKVIKKPKNEGSTSALRTGGTAYGGMAVKEAAHAAKATSLNWRGKPPMPRRATTRWKLTMRKRPTTPRTQMRRSTLWRQTTRRKRTMPTNGTTASLTTGWTSL